MENNPLRQFFRRPSIYITLPSQGRFYSTDVLEPTENGELPIYPMSAVDEITSKTPDAVFSGQAVVDIIQSCVPNIKNAWKLNIVDVEAIIIAIRIASHGEKMEITSVCPACDNEANFDVDLINMMQTQRDVNYEETLQANELEIKFRPLTFKETNENNLRQYELQKFIAILNSNQEAPDDTKQTEISHAIKKLNDLLNEMVASSIQHIKSPEVTVTQKEFITDFLANCDRRTSQSVKDHSIKLKTQNDLKPLKLKCLNCNHEYEQELILNITNFFA
jgi:hypothetical protein